MDNVSIKKGNINISCGRDDLIQVDQSPDGMIFNFKGGISFSYIDQYMPIEVKQQIKGAIDHMSGNVQIDLNNYRTPAKIVNF